MGIESVHPSIASGALEATATERSTSAAPGRTNSAAPPRASGATQFRTWLVSFWRDPRATPELSAAYQARQFHEIARHMPLSGMATLSIVAAGVLESWKVTDHGVLLAWSLALLTLAALNHALSRRYGTAAATGQTVPRWAIHVITADLGLGGALYTFLILHLFGIVPERDKLVLAGFDAALISTGGWMFAGLPSAGLVWVFSVCGVTAIGIVIRFPDYAPLAALVAFYCAVLTSTILVTSRKFISGLMIETELDRQRHLVSLLLHDFEESAADWLWETDARGRLRHPPLRLAEAMGCEPSDLLGRELIDVLRTGLGSADPAADGMIDALAANLRGRAPFNAILVPSRHQGRLRWWSIAARPLLDPQGRAVGWRGVGSDVTAAREREREMTRLANFDVLTGLANRHQFGQLMRTVFPADGPATPCTLLMLDLDNFKTVNDSLGHVAGDAMLVAVARRLEPVLGGEGLLARLGGDEFACLVERRLARDEVDRLGRLVRDALAEPWTYENHIVDMHASVGVAFGPDDASTDTGLLKASDLALYAAKAAGRDTLRFFDPSMNEHAARRLRLLGDMRKGLARGEFAVHYQPQIRLCDGMLVGFEALARWHHASRGSVSPSEFIPLAEDSGFIVALGAFVLAEACRDAAEWPESLRIGVNVSAVQIERSNFMDTVEDALKRSGLPHGRLEIELTESALMQHGDALLLLRALRARGVRVALDDFGTGYSSLSYLRTLPIDKLKLDRSFVEALDAEDANGSGATAIVDTIAKLASALGLETCAEGIETASQGRTLDAVGYAYGQGFFYGRPMSADQVRAFIGSRRVDPRVLS